MVWLFRNVCQNCYGVVGVGTHPTKPKHYCIVCKRAAAGIGLLVNAHKMEYMCYNHTGDISTLDGTSLKLVDKLTYLGSSVSSTEKDIDMRLMKAWIAIKRLLIIWKWMTFVYVIGLLSQKIFLIYQMTLIYVIGLFSVKKILLFYWMTLIFICLSLAFLTPIRNSAVLLTWISSKSSAEVEIKFYVLKPRVY